MEYRKVKSRNCTPQNGWKMFYFDEYWLVGCHAVPYGRISTFRKHILLHLQGQTANQANILQGGQQAELALALLFDLTAATTSNPAMVYIIPFY
jgi:hypothetical protein